MAYTLQDSYTTGNDSAGNFTNTTWQYQTFTPSGNYTITRVSLPLTRGTSGTYLTLTASIRATSAGKPTGSDLTSGTLDASTIQTTAWDGTYYNVNVTGLALSSGTVYALVVRQSGTGTCSWIDDSTGNYDGGTEGYSLDSGSSWTISGTRDHLFKTYSGSEAIEVPIIGSVTGTSSLTGVVSVARSIIGVITGTSSFTGDAKAGAALSVVGVITGISSVSATIMTGTYLYNYSRKHIILAGSDAIWIED